MDEPLSNLDAKLRVGLRDEIRDLQRSLGITTIYVTHDQEEALVISDRICVMQGGRVHQVAPPDRDLQPARDALRRARSSAR
jgi:iron(III) transport system ATP-binding protein